MSTVEQRVDRLEDVMSKLAEEMIDFKNEMADFKNEMTDFKNEMTDFKNEMTDFKNEGIKDRQEHNKRWGELANRLGTVIEDIILPGAPFALKRKFGIEIQNISVRTKLRNPLTNMLEEFDLIAVGDDNNIYTVEVKSKINNNSVDSAKEKAARLKELFYPDRKVIALLGALSCDNESVKNYASNNGVYIIAMKGEYLEIVN
ncbi:MAG: hypothetical protein A2014_07155 [Spirochaetes bacterium GWF1_49_6]|nr:MAG: hypothetical protein A2014_07155 [Spirochaetes bacterium GWF1_49_6]